MLILDYHAYGEHMISELFSFIEEHRAAVCIVVVLFAIGAIGAISVYMITAPGPAHPAVTPAAQSSAPGPTPAPSPTPTATAEPTPQPSPTPVPSPTVTPDMAIERSITPLDQYAMNHMAQVDKSMTTGVLSIDMFNSDTGGEYAYVNDTYTVRLKLVDISNEPIDRIRIRSALMDAAATDHVLYEGDRIDYVLLRPGDKIDRTVGFTVKPDTPQGKYVFRVNLDVYSQENSSWLDSGCSYETGLNILKAP